MKEGEEMCLVCGRLPVDSFVVVVGVKELDLLICLRTGEVTRDGGMHEQEEIKCCRSWKKGHNSLLAR